MAYWVRPAYLTTVMPSHMTDFSEVYTQCSGKV